MKFERFQLATEDILTPASFSPQRLRFQLTKLFWSGIYTSTVRTDTIPEACRKSYYPPTKRVPKGASPINYSKRSYQNSVRLSRRQTSLTAHSLGKWVPERPLKTGVPRPTTSVTLPRMTHPSPFPSSLPSLLSFSSLFPHSTLSSLFPLLLQSEPSPLQP
jgi:hypothetical protein